MLDERRSTQPSSYPTTESPSGASKRRRRNEWGRIETLNYLSSSDDDDSSSDDDEDTQPVNAIADDPRPLVPATWRYRVGDILLYTAAFFNAQPGGLNGLEAPPMRRDRTGIIRTRTRERPRGTNRGQYLYTVLFNDPATTVPRLPLDNDADATFLAET